MSLEPSAAKARATASPMPLNIFFFSSRRRHTRLQGDWSSDVCSSDLYCISTPEPPRDLFTRIAFGRVRVTVFLTEEHARHTLAVAPFLRRAQQRVIHNGVDCRLFHPDEAAGRAFREQYDLPGGPLLVGVGALAPEKRWDLLLEAVALMAPPPPPLLLCGSGALERALRAQARRLGVNATFLGQVEPLALVGAYNAATCVVHTRPDETFGLALAEAMACGRPVLAWASGGPVEVVGDARSEERRVGKECRSRWSP